VQAPKKDRGITIRFDDLLKKELESVARQTGLTEGELVRLCVRRFIEEIKKHGEMRLKVKISA
jgi:antitoxin component of RelBE/YafQ-DinJ toxin-antitoxin module